MTKETWITAGTAAKILEERFGRPIRVDYVTRLGSLGRIRKQDIGSRIVLYHRNDIEAIQIKERKKPSTDDRPSHVENHVPVETVRPSQESLPMDGIPKTETAQKLIVAPNSAIPLGLPEGCLNLKQFVDDNGISESKFRQWMKEGVEGDRLERSYYMNEKNRQSACFTEAEQAINLMILRKHGIIK